MALSCVVLMRPERTTLPLMWPRKTSVQGTITFFFGTLYHQLLWIWNLDEGASFPKPLSWWSRIGLLEEIIEDGEAASVVYHWEGVTKKLWKKKCFRRAKRRIPNGRLMELDQ